MTQEIESHASSRFRFGDWLNRGIQAFTDQWQSWLVQMLIAALIAVVALLACVLPVFLVAGPLACGLTTCALRGVRGQRIDARSLGNGWRLAGRSLVAWLGLRFVEIAPGALFMVLLSLGFGAAIQSGMIGPPRMRGRNGPPGGQPIMEDFSKSPKPRRDAPAGYGQSPRTETLEAEAAEQSDVVIIEEEESSDTMESVEQEGTKDPAERDESEEITDPKEAAAPQETADTVEFATSQEIPVRVEDGGSVNAADKVDILIGQGEFNPDGSDGVAIRPGGSGGYGTAGPGGFSSADASFLIGLLVFYGLMFLGMAAMFFWSMWFGMKTMFVFPLIVDRGCSFMEAFTESWRLTRSRTWELLVVQFLAYIVGMIGYYGCCVGLIVTLPLYCCIIAATYELHALPQYTPPAEDELPESALQV
ncbi:MAG: glycerophosphoryl diester phosphodiesterase membrane domain-containing protein [Planctomycetales bacterium]